MTLQNQTTAAISVESKYLMFWGMTSRKLTFFKQETYPHPALKSLKKLKKLPWRGIEPRSDDWQAKKGPLSQLFNSIQLCKNFACNFNVT